MAVATVQAWLLDGDRWVPLKRDACGGAAAWLKVFVSPPDGDSTAARIDVIDVLTGTLEFEAALSKINALRRIEGSEELFFALDCLEASKTLALRFEDEDAMNRTRGELLAAAGEAEAVEVDAVNPQVLEQRVALCKHLVATGFSEGDVARAQAALGDGVSFNDCINWIFDNVVEDAPAAPVPAPSPRKAYPAPPPFSPMRPTAAAADALDDAADEAVLVLAKGDFRDASTRVSRRVSWPDEKAQVDDVCTPEVEEVQVRTLQGEEVQARTPQVDEVQARTPLKAKPPPRTKPPPPPPRTKSPPPPERPPAEGPPAEAPPAEAPPAAPTTSRDAVLVVRRKPPPPPMPKKPPPPSLHPSPSLHAAPTGEGAPRQARPQRDAPPAAAAPPPMAAALIPSAHDSRLTANIDDTDAAPAYRGIFSVDLDDVDAPAHGCRLSADFDDTDVAPAYRGSFSADLDDVDDAPLGRRNRRAAADARGPYRAHALPAALRLRSHVDAADLPPDLPPGRWSIDFDDLDAPPAALRLRAHVDEADPQPGRWSVDFDDSDAPPAALRLRANVNDPPPGRMSFDDADAAPAYRGSFSADLDDADAPAYRGSFSADLDTFHVDACDDDTDEARATGAPFVSGSPDEMTAAASAAVARLGGLSGGGSGNGLPLQPADFEPMLLLGRGAWSDVVLVRHRESRELFAMKVLSKHQIVSNEMQALASFERDVLRKLRHPFLARLRYSFQTPTRLYVVTDWYACGSLEDVLQDVAFKGAKQKPPRRGLGPDSAKLLVAEVALGLEHLHSRSILHRDIKSANVLICEKGHAHLADFGLSKEDRRGNPNAKASPAKRPHAPSFVGTPSYMAPELLLKDAHRNPKASDWWAVGVLFVEVVEGRSPFYADTPRQLFINILRSQPVISFDDADYARAAKSLLVKLPQDRADVRQLQQQSFFPSDYGPAWVHLQGKAISPKFVPSVRQAVSPSQRPSKDSKLIALFQDDVKTPKGSRLHFPGFSFRQAANALDRSDMDTRDSISSAID